MQQFRINEEGIALYRKRILRKLIPMALIAAIIVLLICTQSPMMASVGTDYYFVAAIAAFAGFSAFRAIKKQVAFLRSLSFTITDDEIVREMMDTRQASIGQIEIGEILKSGKGNFSITSIDGKRRIDIPYFIEHADRLEERLGHMATIKVIKGQPKFLRIQLYMFLLTAGLFLVLISAGNNMIGGISGILAAGIMSWRVYQIQTSANVPDSAKKRNWLKVFPILCLLLISYLRLTGQL